MFAVLFAVSVLLPVAFILLTVGRIPVWLIFVYAAVTAALALFARNRIFLPIATIEKVLEGVSAGNTDFDMEALERYAHLSEIFTRLETLVENVRNLKTRESNAQLMKQQAELEALQSQINPHFLYNTLDCIRGQAMHYGIRDIEVMTRSLSKIFRYSISNHDSVVSLEDELDNIDSYLHIQQMRFNDKFVVEKNIDDDAPTCTVPKLIIQPIVENAIHHGLELKVGPGHIRIEAYLTDSRLVIKVNDNGCGIPGKRLEEINETLLHDAPLTKKSGSHTSVGLANVNARIKLLYGPEYGVSVYSSEDVGTSVHLNLPIIRR